MIEKYKHIFLFVIILLGIVLRFFLLGVNPPSLDWDEASLGYNAYSILKTGADEYGDVLPLSIRSFDDYKPPAYVYLTVPSIALFGLTEFAVRLPSAILGILTIPVAYYLVLELLSTREKKTRDGVALLTAFFISVSPWHLQFSRAAFEGNIGLFFFLFGVLMLLKGIKQPQHLFFSMLSFVVSVYSYHSFRLIIPLFLFGVFVLFSKELLAKKKIVFISLGLFLLLSLPIWQSFLHFGAASSRLSMVSGIGSSDQLTRSIKELQYDKERNDNLGLLLHNRRVIYGLQVVKGYLDHFNPDFLFLHGDGGRQHHAVDMGMLYLWELPFIILGLFWLSRKTDKRIVLLFSLLFVAPLASAVTSGTPHPVRAIIMLFPLHVFTAAGVYIATVHIANIKYRLVNIPLRVSLFAVCVLLFLFNFTYYLHQYYVHTPIEYGDFWQYGYKEAFLYAKGEENNVRKIIVTYTYDQPYIYYLFYNKIDPSWYQKHWDYLGNGSVERMRRVIGKYEFKNFSYGQARDERNTLLIGSPNEIGKEIPGVVKEILFPDGTVGFRIIKT